jgi:DNA-binding MarR family transcriptional regulator
VAGNNQALTGSWLVFADSGMGFPLRIDQRFTYARLAYVKDISIEHDGDGARPDVLAFESLTRALVGIALESVHSAGHEVTLPQFRLLLALDGLGRVPSSRLAAQLGLAASAITRMADRVEQAGLVRRGADPRSRCIVTVELTNSGRELVAAVLARRHERLAAVLDLMSPQVHASAVAAAREFTALSGDAVALGESGPVPV